MKNKTLGAFMLAATLAIASTPGYALTFQFSFTNSLGSVAGTVTGLINGLTDNTTSSATQVIIQSYPTALSLPPAPFDIADVTIAFAPNTFTVANGSITSALFHAQSVSSADFCLSFASSGGCAGGAFLANSGFGFVMGPVSFTSVAVPGPAVGAGLPGLVLAFGGALAWRRRRRQAA